ncbi:MAG: DNA-binding protein [Deltaproteobacteria bacterium]|nr:DNA-binding protein [Deltaproteobacteria bacterium]
MRIFLDANILFSASIDGSATRLLLDAALRYADECITSPHAYEEARRNIEAKRPGQSAGFKEISKNIVFCNAFYTDLSIDLPQQDIPVLAGAIGAQCTHLWTGDKEHFGPLYGKTIQGVQVVSGIMLADILMDLGWRPIP